MVGNPVAFYVLAFVAVASAVGVVTFRNAVYSMLSLILNLLSLAAFFLMLQALFVATIQILIYAGAVMVLFLFVVTMLAPDTTGATGPDRFWWQWAAAGGLGIILASSLIFAAQTGAIAADARALGSSSLARQVAANGDTQAFGLALFHGYAFPFEVTGVLLVISVLGAVVLGRRMMRESSLSSMRESTAPGTSGAPQTMEPAATSEPGTPVRQ
jgi:NADH-quinone oxidoreductase subunit J